MNNRLKKLICNKLNTVSTNFNSLTTSQERKFFVIPYIKNISKSITSTNNKDEFIIGYRVLNKLDNFIKASKDRNQISSNNNVVYKIFCKNCDVSYVGRTKRQLKTRLKEHINNIKSHATKHSVASEHILNYEHEFD